MDHPITVPSDRSIPRLVLFGLDCIFSNTVLSELAASATVNIVALCLPGHPKMIRPLHQPAPQQSKPGLKLLAAPSSIVGKAHEHGIDVFRIGNLSSVETVDLMSSFQADLLLVACFNSFIPSKLYNDAPLGALNLHTSLLPAKRGPDPMFWTFRDGDGSAGVTIHRLSDSFDAGPILSQIEVCYRDGVREADLDSDLAFAAARRFLDMVPRLTARLINEMPQDDGRATSARFPEAPDYQIDTNRSARQAFNFIHGLWDRGQPFTIWHHGRRWRVLEALDYSNTAEVRRAPSQPDEYLVSFTPGTLLVRLRRLEPSPSLR